MKRLQRLLGKATAVSVAVALAVSAAVPAGRDPEHLHKELQMELTRKASIAAAAALTAAAVLGVATPASAGNLIAYDGTSYSGLVLVNAASAPVIDVADDKTSSVKNQTSNTFSGRNTVGLVSFQIFSFSPNGAWGSLGGANNAIDHFDRV